MSTKLSRAVAAETAIVQIIIYFINKVEVEYTPYFYPEWLLPLDILFKWAIPAILYMLVLFRIMAAISDDYELSRKFVSYISIVSEFGILYIIFGIFSDYTGLVILFFGTFAIVLGEELLFGNWMEDFAVSLLNHHTGNLPYVENIKSVAEDSPSTITDQIKSLVSLFVMLLILLPIFTIMGWFLGIGITTILLLHFFKTVIASMYSLYGGAEYEDIMNIKVGLTSLTLNWYILQQII
jgi:hypothetical protein